MKSICKIIIYIGAGVLITSASFAKTEKRSRVSNKGYSFDDSGKKIKSTESDGHIDEIISKQNGIATPCSGKFLPSSKTRNASIKPHLRCAGSKRIDQERSYQNFEKDPQFKKILDTGDQYKIYSYMREKSKKEWNYNLSYSTNVDWSWTRKFRGKSSSNCGYSYRETTCTKTISLQKRTCKTVTIETPSTDSTTGSGSGGFAPSGSRPSSPAPSRKKDYEDTNPFGFHPFIDLLINKAHATTSTTCSSWKEYDTKTEDFKCYHRFVRSCEWTEQASDTFQCSQENLPISIKVPSKEEVNWNPDHQQYVPFLPNGNDLLPGEFERMQINVDVRGSDIYYSNQKVVGGKNGSQSSFYQYEHSVKPPRFDCSQNVNNDSLVWTMLSKDRQITKTPNSLFLNYPGETNEQSKNLEGFSKTGLFDENGDLVFNSDSDPNISSLPASITILDESSRILNSITAAFRASDRRDDDQETIQDNTKTVSKGQASAGSKNRFWKDTFYKIKLVEVYPNS